MTEHLLKLNFINHTYVLLCPVNYFLVYQLSKGLVSVVNKKYVIEPSEPALSCRVRWRLRGRCIQESYSQYVPFIYVCIHETVNTQDIVNIMSYAHSAKILSIISTLHRAKTEMVKLENTFLEGCYEIPPQCLPSTSTDTPIDKVNGDCDLPILLCDSLPRSPCQPKWQQRERQPNWKKIWKNLRKKVNRVQPSPLDKYYLYPSTVDNFPMYPSLPLWQYWRWPNNGWPTTMFLQWDGFEGHCEHRVQNVPCTTQKENEVNKILALLVSITVILQKLS